MQSIFDMDSYSAPVDYLISQYIREYDMSKANINILLYYGMISKEQYQYYYDLPKKQREISIGCLQRDHVEIKDALKQGFVDMRHRFYAANDIKDYDILSVKKDAIFLINKSASNTKFKNVEFVCKNLYTSFYRIDRVEYYYLYDSINKQEKLDVKGLGQYAEEVHRDYMLDFMKYIFCMAQNGQILDCIKDIRELSINMISGNLDPNFYRELNNRAMFRSKIKINGTRFFMQGINCTTSLNDLDPSYNLGILSELYKVYSGIALRR